MAGIPSVNEQAAVSDHERVAKEEAARAERLGWAADAINCLLDPRLSPEARTEIFGLILETRTGERISLDRPAELGLEQNLGRAHKEVTGAAETAQNIGTIATEMAEHIEHNGLPR